MDQHVLPVQVPHLTLGVGLGIWTRIIIASFIHCLLYHLAPLGSSPPFMIIDLTLSSLEKVENWENSWDNRATSFLL